MWPGCSIANSGKSAPDYISLHPGYVTIYQSVLMSWSLYRLSATYQKNDEIAHAAVYINVNTYLESC